MPAVIVCSKCGESPEHSRDDAETGLLPDYPCEDCGACFWQVYDVDSSELEDFDQDDDSIGDCSYCGDNAPVDEYGYCQDCASDYSGSGDSDECPEDCDDCDDCRGDW